MNTPTLCLVMDGERIVSYEVGSIQDLDLPQYVRDAQENGWIVRTIPLSLCALAPEMRECLESVSTLAVAHREFLKTTEHAWMLGDGSERIEKAQSLLSRINPQ